MKNIKIILVILCVVGGIVSCKDWVSPENIQIQDNTGTNEPKSDAYYENLRAYKKSDHAIAFGWFGGWSDDGAGVTRAKTLANAPDSMDIMSIWSPNRYNLTDAQKADMNYVQQVKGTRITFTFFAHNMVNALPNEAISQSNKPSDIPQFAAMLADSVYKYNYDGVDLDYESATGDLFNDRNNMESLLRELRANLPDKLILVDGYLNLSPNSYQYVDYLISQAYATSGDLKAQARWDGVKGKIRADQFIITENLESYWSTGGVPYTQLDGNQTSAYGGRLYSLEGMAAFTPKDSVRKGGFGSYHMEYEYSNSPDYKYMRQAIQVQNPAKIN